MLRLPPDPTISPCVSKDALEISLFLKLQLRLIMFLTDPKTISKGTDFWQENLSLLKAQGLI